MLSSGKMVKNRVINSLFHNTASAEPDVTAPLMTLDVCLSQHIIHWGVIQKQFNKGKQYPVN